MAFMKDILTHNIPIWEECAATPFGKNVQTGKLPLEKFKRYMIQDSIYLKNYARIYGKAIFHADTLREIQLYYSMLNFVNDTESEVRLDYLKQFCITDDDTPDMIEKQIDAVFEDIEVDAVKIGMLSTPECMKAVAKKLLQYKPQNVVIDPVMYAKNGCPLMNPTAVSTLIDTVIPLADVLTPNIPEAEKIADMQISTVSDMEAAARKIYAMGCKAIVVKGGHHIGNAVDVLFNGENFYHFETSRIDTKNTHGTGCTFSSAIASQLAKGKSVPLAVESAKAYVTMAIEHSLAIGKGCGPTHHFYELYQHGLSKE